MSEVGTFTTPIINKAGAVYRGEPVAANVVGAVYPDDGGEWLAVHLDEQPVRFADWEDATSYVARRALGWA